MWYCFSKVITKMKVLRRFLWLWAISNSMETSILHCKYRWYKYKASCNESYMYTGFCVVLLYCKTFCCLKFNRKVLKRLISSISVYSIRIATVFIFTFFPQSEAWWILIKLKKNTFKPGLLNPDINRHTTCIKECKSSEGLCSVSYVAITKLCITVWHFVFTYSFCWCPFIWHLA